MVLNNSYKLFLSFFEAYAPGGFKDMDASVPLLVELEALMEKNNQFFYIGDMFSFEVLFVSKRILPILGVEPRDFKPAYFFEVVHPDDAERLSLGKSTLFKMTHTVHNAGKGHVLLSTNFRLKNGEGNYSNILMQVLVFYSIVPHPTVYMMKIHTVIDWCGKSKCPYHYYLGDDLSNFRSPDKDLLIIGVPYSKRELEIIRQASRGLNSEEIAEKLFLSTNTVFTHRRNILKKAHKNSLSDVIYDLMKQGLL